MNSVVEEIKARAAEAVARGDAEYLKDLVAELAKQTNKKLEERALEIAGMKRNAASDDIEDLRELARELGNDGALWILDQKAQEIGWSQVNRVLAPVRKIKQRERELEDYLSVGDNLEKVEQGLKFRDRQEVIHSGRLDISATDATGRETTVELKADPNYDAQGVALQVIKYAHEKPDSRVILVAPTVKPELFFTLKDLHDQGRLDFREVKKENDGFTFSEFDPARFDGQVPNGKKFTAKTRTRPTGEVSFVRTEREFEKVPESHKELIQPSVAVSRSGIEQGNDVSTTSNDRPEALDPIETMIMGATRGYVRKRGQLIVAPDFINDPKFPLYYQTLGMVFPEIPDHQRFLDKVPVERKQMVDLEFLVGNGYSMTNLDRLNQVYRYSTSDDLPTKISDLTDRRLKGLFWALLDKMGEASKVDEQIRDWLDNLLGGLPNLDSLKLEEERVSIGERSFKVFQSRLDKNQRNNDYDRLLQELKFIASNGGLDDKDQRSAEMMVNSLDPQVSNSEVEFFRNRLRRTRKLAEVDPEMAALYLTHTPRTYHSIKNMATVNVAAIGSAEAADLLVNGTGSLPLSDMDVVRGSRFMKGEGRIEASLEYFERDNELYKSILSRFVVKDSSNRNDPDKTTMLPSLADLTIDFLVRDRDGLEAVKEAVKNESRPIYERFMDFRFNRDPNRGIVATREISERAADELRRLAKVDRVLEEKIAKGEYDIEEIGTLLALGRGVHDADPAANVDVAENFSPEFVKLRNRYLDEHDREVLKKSAFVQSENQKKYATALKDLEFYAALITFQGKFVTGGNLNAAQEMSLEKILALHGEKVEELSKLANSEQGITTRARRIYTELLRKADSEEARKQTRRFAMATLSHRLAGEVEYRRQVYARTKALSAVDSEAAAIYLAHTELISRAFNEFIDHPARAVVVEGSPKKFMYFRDYMKQNTELYQALVDRFTVAETPRVEATARKTTSVQSVNGNGNGAHARTQERDPLYDAITGGNGETLTAEMVERIKYFVNEDAPRYAGSAEQTAQLVDAFGRFKLHKHVRDRKAMPSERQFRTFFDDVMLSMHSGNIPDAQGLESMYRAVRADDRLK